MSQPDWRTTWPVDRRYEAQLPAMIGTDCVPPRVSVVATPLSSSSRRETSPAGSWAP